MVQSLRTTHPDTFNALIHAPAAHRLLYHIEQDIRARYWSVCNLIDSIRMHWNKSAVFRDKFLAYSCGEAPPESFYRSALFYRDHFKAIQLCVLEGKWRHRRLSVSRQALSDVDFVAQVEEFAQHSQLLQSLECANHAATHELSIKVCS